MRERYLVKNQMTQAVGNADLWQELHRTRTMLRATYTQLVLFIFSERADKGLSNNSVN